MNLIISIGRLHIIFVLLYDGHDDWLGTLSQTASGRYVRHLSDCVGLEPWITWIDTEVI